MKFTTQFKFIISIAILFLNFDALSQQYVNGNLSTGGINGAGVAAPFGSSWSEVQSGNTALGYNANAGSFLLADDFNVCTNWTVSKITFFAYVNDATISDPSNTTSPFNKLVVAIYNGDPQSGGTPVGGLDTLSTNNYLSNSSSASIYRIPNATTNQNCKIWKIEVNLNTVLGPGTYWLVFSMGNNAPGSLTSFVPASTVAGTTTQSGNNAKKLTISNGTWGALSDGGGPQDLPFIIDYTSQSCSGQPAPGATNSTLTTACPNLNFTLTLDNPNCENGISNQWQFSTNGGTTWTNIAGANLSYLTTSLLAAGVPSSATTVLFRDSLRCANSGLTNKSTPESITQSNFLNCYCTPGNTNCTGSDDILNVTFGGINNNSTAATDCPTGNNGYVDFTGIPAGNVYSGINNPISVIVNNGGSENAAAWIDYDHSGTFDRTEFIDFGSGVLNSNSKWVFTGSVFVSGTAVNGKTRIRVRSKFAVVGSANSLAATDACTAYTWGQTEDYFINISPAQVCNGTNIIPGIISSSSASVCPSASFTLTPANATTLASLTGVTFQWQKSSNNSSWSDIAGATAITYTGTQIDTTYYKLNVTCSGGSFSASPSKKVGMNSFVSCYCIPGFTRSDDNDITTNVTYAGINNNSTNSPNNGYSDYTSTVAPAVAYRNLQTPISVTIPSGFSENAAVWIDYDHNGIFDPAEFTWLGSTTSSGGVITNVITIPSNSLLGLTRMRVRIRFSTTLVATDVCNGYSYGETEDYLVNIQDVVNCSGAPSLGDLIPNFTSLCSGDRVTITSSNASALSGTLGLTLQWNYSSSSTGPWTTISSGYPSIVDSLHNGSTYFQLVGTCNISGITSTKVVLISLNPQTSCYCASNATASNSSDITRVKIGSLDNSSDCSSVAPGVGTVPNRYSNYTSGTGAPAPALIYSGTSNAISVSLDICDSRTNANAIAIWIDLNKNGLFEDATEKLYTSSVTSSTFPRIDSGALRIPTTFTNGGTDTIRGITRMRIVNSSQTLSSITSCGTYQYGETEDYLVNIQYAPACNSSFVPQLFTSFDTVCENIPFTISLQNATGISGLTFQWQSSPDSSVWTNVSGQTSTTLSTSLTTTTFYRIITTCSVSSSADTSAGVKIVKGNLGCYCVPLTTAGVLDAITNIKFGGFNNTSAYTNGGFTNYSSSVSTGTGTIGGSDSIYVTISGGSGAPEYVAAWIDYNQDGIFQPTEYAAIGSLSGSTTTLADTINIPANALPGLTRMRIRVRRTNPLTANDACATYSNGETEDYQVNLIPCAPVTFDVAPVNTSVTCGNNTYFAVKVISVNTPTYKWQYRTSPTGAWTFLSNGINYSGVTSDTLRVLSVPLSFSNYEYRVVVKGNCELPDTSVAGKLSVVPSVVTNITSQPSNVTVSCSSTNTASFSFTVTSGSSAYQWQSRANANGNWTNLANNTSFTGVTTTNLTVIGLSNALNGYQFRAYVSAANCSTSDTSSEAILTITPLALSVSLSTPSTTVCKGSDVVFTATPIPSSGLVGANYKFRIDSITMPTVASPTGGSTTVFTTNTIQLIVGMEIGVTLGRGTIPNGTTITSINPGVSFTTSNPVSVLTSTVIFGVLQNGSSPSITTQNIQTGNKIKCILTVNDLCAVPQTANSNILSMTVTPNTKDSLLIAASANPICSGTNVNFTASPYNGGPNATYQWFIGSTSVQGPSSAATYTNLGTLTDQQIVTCKMVPDNTITCPSANPAISNAVTMSINPSFPVSVSLAANPTANPDVAICLGASVTFTATATNGGVSPQYVFRKKNGASDVSLQSGTSNTYTTTSLTNNDSVYCILTSSITSCAPGNPATSNKIKITTTAVAPIVTISQSPRIDSVCAGASVTYTANPQSGQGSSPSYQFYVNGQAVTNSGNTYTYIPGPGDSISVAMTSSNSCASPNPATAYVIQTLKTRPTTSISLSSLTCGSNSATMDAGASAGSGTITAYQWYLGGVSQSGGTQSTFYTTTAGNYKVLVTNSLGCKSDTTTLTTTNPYTLTLGAGAALAGTYTIGSVKATVVTWPYGGSSVKIKVTGSSLTVGSVISVTTGSGVFPANTVVTGISGDTIIVNNAPTTPLSASNIISGATCSNYINFASAITDLNIRGVSASCVFNASAGYTENLTARLDLGSTLLNSQLSITKTITFQKSGSGANPVINAYTTGTATPASAIPDGIWALSGADYVTIDGINLTDGNIANPATMEYGFGLFRKTLTDGSQNNTIKNCVITLNKINNANKGGNMPEGATGILILNATDTGAISTSYGTNSTATGANSNNKFYSNTIQNCNYGIYATGFAATNGGTSPADGDFGNDIGGASSSTGNTILNFGGGAGSTLAAAGVVLNNQWGANISFNTLNNNNGSGTNHASNSLRGIYGQAGTSANVTISNNNITLKGGGGTINVTAIDNSIGTTSLSNTVDINNNTITGEYSVMTTGAYTCILNAATATNVNINGNTIQNISLATATTGTFTAISNTAITTLNVKNNTIQNDTLRSTGTFLGISNGGAITTSLKVENNSFNNNTKIGTGTMTLIATGTLTGATASSSVSFNNITNNSITGGVLASTLNCLIHGGTTGATYYDSSNTINNNFITNMSGSAIVATIYGITNTGGQQNENILKNTISNLYVTGTSTGIHVIQAIRNNTASGTPPGSAIRNVLSNNIFNLYSNGGSSANIVGIYSQAGGTVTISKNRIYNLFTGYSSGTGPISRGIQLAAGTNNTVSNNFIAIDQSLAASVTNSIARDSVNNVINGIIGIDVSSTAVNSASNLFYNTIRVKGNGSGNYGSSAINHAASTTATTDSLTLKNNIIVNESTPLGTGVVVAYRRTAGSASNLVNYTSTSNNNLFYAGTPGVANLIYSDGTSSAQTIAQYKNGVFTAGTIAPRDASSVSGLPEFISSTDLHLNACGQVVVDSVNGKATVFAGIITDYDNENRDASTPDIGADEVTANSTAGSVSNNATVCSGNNSGTLTLSGYSGTIQSWQSASDVNFTSPVSISNTNSTYSYPNITATTYFRAVVTSSCSGNPTVYSLPALITVNPTPSITSSATGSISVCQNGTIQLSATNPALSNPWTSSTPGVASISNTGLVSGLTAGTTTIRFTNTNGCYKDTLVTVNALPTISGTLFACVGATTQLSGSGTAASSTPWSSSNNSIATVSNTGLVTGVTTGTVTINYTNNNACTTTSASLTVSGRPTITGTTTLCVGSSVTLTGTPGTGTQTATWSASNANATVNGSGFVTGVSGGSSTIRYTNTFGCFKDTVITINALPTISGTTGVCVGDSTQLTGDGTNASLTANTPWFTANSSIASLTNAASTSRFIKGVASGSTNITYTNSNGCAKTVAFEVYTPPAAPTAVSNGAFFCGPASVTIQATPPSGLTIDWYSASSGGTVLSGGSGVTSFTTPVISSNTTYYAQTVNLSGCKSLTRTPVAANITAKGTWLGVDTVWSNTANWCDGILPIDTVNITIPSGLSKYPSISSNALCKNITINSGASLTVLGNGKLTINGSITNSGGTFDVSRGTIELAGSTAVSLNAAAFRNKRLRNLIINNSGGVSITGTDTLQLFNKLSFVGTGKTFTINDKLALKSSDTLTAMVDSSVKGNTISGNAIVERYITNKRAWRLLAMPTSHNAQNIRQSLQENASASIGFGTQLSGGTAQNFGTEGWDAYSKQPSMKILDSTGSKWNAVAKTTDKMVPGKAYLTFIRGDRTTNFPNTSATVLRERGKLITGDSTLSYPSSTVSQYFGVGNLYAAPIDFRKMLSNGLLSNIRSTYYLWDPKASDYGAYVSCSVVSNNIIATPQATNSYANGNYNIQSGQGFIVQQINPGTSSITFKETIKADSLNLVSRVGIKEGMFRANLYKVANGTPQICDGVLNMYDSAYTNDLNDKDVLKLINPSENFGIKNGNTSLAIEFRNGLNDNDTVFYNLSQVRVADYQFEFIPSNLNATNMEAYLEDAYLNTKTQVSLTNATLVNFNIVNAPGSYNPDRFRVVFKVLKTVPVTFVNIKAVKEESKIRVTWNVANEININNYTVERSSDGVHFGEVGNVLSQNIPTYSFVDQSPLSGINYYRIRSNGFNNDKGYSNIVKVSIQQEPSITMFPNPVKQNEATYLRFVNMSKGSYQIRVLNNLGQIIMKKSITHNGMNAQYLMDYQKKLISGNYTIEITNEFDKTKTSIKFLF